MAFDAHANFATSLVATAPSPASSGPSLVVTAAQGSRFPAVPFNAVVGPANTLLTPSNAEIVRVTAISTDTFTITRAQEGSSARSILVGDQIYNGPTVKTFTDLEVVDAAAATGSLRTLGTGAAQAAAGDQTEFAFSSWKDILLRSWTQGSGAAAVTNLFYEAGFVALNTGNSALAAFYLNPTDYPGGTRATKLRVRAFVVTNAVAPTVNYTFGLYPVATWVGASNVAPGVGTLSAATTSVAINAPNASTQTVQAGSAVAFPAAGWFVLAVANSGTTATNSQATLGLALQVQQV